MNYRYRSTGPLLTPKEAAEEAKRNGLDPRVPGEPIVTGLPGPSSGMKGAVKVDGFPAHSIYPFEQIAADGGVWKIDPAEFTAKVTSIRKMACNWAATKGLGAKTVIDDGYLYVQFTGGES